jgi:hypothetical protein
MRARTSRRRRPFSIIVASALALVMALTTAGMAAAATLTHTDADETLAWPGSAANQASYWEAHLLNHDGMDIDCVKINESGAFTVGADYAAVVVKAGQLNYIWFNVPSGTEIATESPGISHYYLCGESVNDIVIDPKASIEGPCADPAYYAVFDNSASDISLKFKFVWYNKLGKHVTTKNVPAGAVFTTWQHWVKPFTQMKVGYKDPNTGLWINLAKRESVKGVYPICEYTPGFSFPDPQLT